ncbi:MAG: hypothetical protein JXR46_06010 [Calditrichaceae bacterium]|nr:hypothetical protein [Calditrichaceae bacterium]MBN2708580.1 hypothetical protein [Calditrichaceae bacterium]RQV94082.1 MAG: hypothetical protein EH224_11075 [Calditrichota bacterium]
MLKTKSKIILGLTGALWCLSAFAEVPVPQMHQPSLPYFMQRISFQTVTLGIFGGNTSGLVMDKYSDLNWNPAFVLADSENAVYTDFNYLKPAASYYNYYSGQDAVSPNWYYDTQINSLQTDPLYNFAFVYKVNPNFSFGIINRSLFDYGPFRSISDWRYYSTGTNARVYDASAYNELELKTVEVARNQQKIWGTQTEIFAGYKLSSQIDIGIKAGNYIFRQWGDLFDTRYSGKLHSLVDEKNDEDFRIHGDQAEFGAGFIYHFDHNMDLGIYASVLNGQSSEKNISFDLSDYWSERATDTNYYSIDYTYLQSRHSYSADGLSPFFTIIFQKAINPIITLRSFFSYRQTKNDISGSINAADTAYSDRTFDSYDYNNQRYYFTRDEGFRKTEFSLTGIGDENEKDFKWFVSLIFNQDNKWSAFTAVMLEMQTNDLVLNEESIYSRNAFTQRFFYNPGSEEQYNYYLKNYRYEYNSKLWSAIIPVGINANIIDGFSLLIGADLRFDLLEKSESGDMLYPERIERITQNGTITIEDIETDRPESYNSHQPKEFTKTSAIHFGAFYEHSSGLRLAIKTDSDILDKSYWKFGLEYVF